MVRPSVAARILCQGEQVGAATQRLALVNLVEDVPGKLLGQFLSWHSRVGFFSLDGRVDYLESLATVEIPCLIIGADSDRLAPPESVEPAYEKLAAQDKQIRILGSERGDDGDYGHGDLLLGRMAPQEVFPMLVEWLERRATPFSENQSGDEA
ncbi:MAG: hypothetical protein D6806_07750 [Deltaproteobacteria bacterium]|nr:MAG: hypothetical protein D6806_07750 [Deltaproteobacteria bacterium]